jgi:hypothetical protein
VAYDPYELASVKGYLEMSHFSMTGHFLKLIDRLGDRLAISLIIVTNIEGLYERDVAIRAARALGAAFDTPSSKRCEADSLPRAAIFLLEHLLQRVVDSSARAELGASLVKLRDLTARSR